MIENIILQILFLSGYGEYKEYDLQNMAHVLFNHQKDLGVDPEEIINALYEIDTYYLDFNEKEDAKLNHCALKALKYVNRKEANIALEITEEFGKHG